MRLDEPLILGEYTPDGGTVLRQGFDPYKDANMRMAKETMRLLNENYPGYGWSVTTDILQGVVMVSIPEVMGHIFKYVIHTSKIETANGMAAEVREAGGQILERFGLSRRGFRKAELIDLKGRMPTGRFLKEVPV